MVRSKEYSNETARVIDEEVHRIIREAYQIAEDLILKNRDKVQLIAETLLENETLSGEEVVSLIRTGKLPPPPEPPEVAAKPAVETTETVSLADLPQEEPPPAPATA